MHGIRRRPEMQTIMRWRQQLAARLLCLACPRCAIGRLLQGESGLRARALFRTIRRYGTSALIRCKGWREAMSKGLKEQDAELVLWQRNIPWRHKSMSKRLSEVHRAMVSCAPPTAEI